MSQEQGHDIGASGRISREEPQDPNRFTLARCWRWSWTTLCCSKLGGDAGWGDYGWAAAKCVSVYFERSCWGEMWKTQSPPVSMETSSRSQAERHREPFHIRKQGCELFHIIARMLLTTDNNVLGRMTISGAVTMKHVNLLKRLKMNCVIHAANICTEKQRLTDLFKGSSYPLLKIILINHFILEKKVEHRRQRPMLIKWTKLWKRTNRRNAEGQSRDYRWFTALCKVQIGDRREGETKKETLSDLLFTSRSM